MSSQIFILTGLSGAGKSTVADALMKDASLAIHRFITTTTRSPRVNEVHGAHYWFISREEFEKERKQGNFYESAEVYGNLYGSSRQEMERLKKLAKPILFVLDVQGAKTFKQLHPEAFVIFLTAPINDLRHRLELRHASEEEIARRLGHIDKEIAHETIANILIENKDQALDQTVQKVQTFIKTSTIPQI